MKDLYVLVCGGRNHDNPELIIEVLDELHAAYRIIGIIHGGAKGADHTAGEWAYANKVGCQEVLADWANDGRAAGPIRNQRMIDDYHVDLVVAFKGGRGTADMVRRARKALIKVLMPEKDDYGHKY